ncbi:hypothetical protein BGZ46_002415 [Entomortierella lignicola]|nr:hypothetical protein BGZ46_002415 [Entomortierella lignicola]
MDSTPSESIHFSPSIKKTNRSRTPRKSTPSRLYLRQSFPTLESPTSTTPSVSPGKSFIQRQQQLQDARDEQEESNELLSERHTQLNNQKEQHISEETAKERLSDTSELPASSDHVRDTQTNTLTEILKRRQWKPQSQTAAINDTTNPVSVAPRLRTTETEYDLSPTRSLRQLSTPPRSLYIGTPSKAFFDSWEHEDLQESDGSVSSPSDMRKARMMSSNSIFNQRSRLENDYSRKERELSPRYTTQDDTDQEDLVGDVVDQEEEGEEVGPEDKEHDDQGYNYGDDEVSFKRSGPVSSSNHSTLIEQESQNQQLDSLHGDNLQDENYSDHEPSPIKEYTPTQKRQLESSFVSETDAEDSLLEVAEKTTAIAEELRSVYSNLQVLFSPENEAKLNGAVSVLSSQKRSSDRSTIENKSFSASIPKPLVS